MSFLYPRTITISRMAPDPTLGSQGYSGMTPDKETIVAQGIPARIQADRQGTPPQAKLPADAAGESIWKIIFKGARDLARTGDIITDDLGERYQIISAYWGPLVTTCRSQILQN